jgi:hypothetical protein
MDGIDVLATHRPVRVFIVNVRSDQALDIFVEFQSNPHCVLLA